MTESIHFTDYYQNSVRLSFAEKPFSDQPRHVWVVCRYHKQWLLTIHPRRGFEFPGGKVEKGESPKQAAVREVDEETGGQVTTLSYIGQYQVVGKFETITKNIYFANIERLTRKKDFFETKGPKLVHSLPVNIKKCSAYSFVMKDEVLTHTINYLQEHGLCGKDT